MSKRTHDDRKKADDDAPVFKVPNKEMILTRGKSTQLRRQLRSKDGIPKVSPSHTQTQKLIKPTGKAVPKSPSAKPSPPEKTSKTVKKVILKPPQKLRKVESIKAEKKVVNKRKATQPQKQILPNALRHSKDSSPPSKSQKPKTTASRPSGSKSADSSPAKASASLKQRYLEDKRSKEMSFAELIRLREQSEELTDDDLLEIVMCPSPVWWEDQCDDRNNEDCNFVTSSAHQTDPMTKAAAAVPKDEHLIKLQSEERSSLIVSRIPDSKYDQGFNKKRSALENVLSDILIKAGKSNKKESCKPSRAIKHKLDKFVSKDPPCSQHNSEVNAMNNAEMHVSDKSIDIDKNYELVELSDTELPNKNTLNQATSTSDTAMKMLKKMHAHIPKIRNVTADCMRRIKKGKSSQVKKVYSGNDSAELIPTKSNRRLDIFIDLSDEGEIERNHTGDKISSPGSHEKLPDNASGNGVQSELVVRSSNSTDEDDVLRDLKNLVIPIALPIESSECIVIDEDEEKTDCQKNESFLGVRESAETQPVSFSKDTIIEVDSDSEHLKEMSSSSNPEHASKVQESSASDTVSSLSQEISHSLLHDKVQEPLCKKIKQASKTNYDNDLKNPNKINKLGDYAEKTSVIDGNLTNTGKSSFKNNREVDPNSLSDCENISDTISDTNIQFLHEDQLLDDTNKKTHTFCPTKEIEKEPKQCNTNDGNKRLSMNSKIQQAYLELVSNIVNKRNALTENGSKQNVNMKEGCRQEIISLNSSIDNIMDPDEELYEKESDTKATIQVFNIVESVPEAHITYDIVTSEAKLLNSLNEDTLRSEENIDQNLPFQNIDDQKESDEENCEYEQMNEIPMTKEMIENIIGVQEAIDISSGTETLEKNGTNPKGEPGKQNIVIAHSENVKYCFSCSSIYDTAECSYCQKKCLISKKMEKVFACRKCNYRSVKKSNMETHAMTHTKEKPFGCDRCKSSFKTKATLKKHMSNHCYSISNRETRDYTSQSDDSYKAQYAKISSEEKMIADGNEIIVILANS